MGTFRRRALWTSGQRGAFREMLNHLEGLRVESGETPTQVSLRIGARDEFWRKLWTRSGPVLDTINRAAGAYGYRLALVPAEEEVGDDQRNHDDRR